LPAYRLSHENSEFSQAIEFGNSKGDHCDTKPLNIAISFPLLTTGVNM